MPIHVVTHEDCILHDLGPAHPESPDRLRAILGALRDPAVSQRITWHEAPLPDRDDLLRVHPSDYLDGLQQFGHDGGGWLDPDTGMTGHSWRAALLAAGGALEAASLALATAEPAFAIVRPPGHHALRERAMGFCLLGNVAIAAYAALQTESVERVLIVDWDVHHGNGTQALVDEEPAIRFISMHQWPLYPGTGDERERGVGNIWNLPRRAGLPPADYVADLTRTIGQATEEWSPDLVLVSAGFDSMAGDPLAGFTLDAADYVTILDALTSLGAPIALTIEGGYDLKNLVAGSMAVTEALS